MRIVPNVVLPSNRRSRGFTLIEMLVVIAIIVVLGGLTLAALGGVRKRSKVQRTQAAILFLGMAIESYTEDFNDFPDSGGDDGHAGSEALLAALLTDEMEGPYIARKDVPSIVDHNENGEKEIGDPWGRPIHYLHKKYYDREGPNKSTFRLYSAGNDGEFDPLNPDADDIVNWDKSGEE